jgi:hypothetical protein
MGSILDHVVDLDAIELVGDCLGLDRKNDRRVVVASCSSWAEPLRASI